jgi:glycosyltransferase involved in cell wall biosynthesis
MRVLHVATAFQRSESDVITPWLTETLCQLRARGIEAEVFTSSYHGLDDQTIFDIPVHRFRYFLKSREDLTHDETTPDRMRKGILYKFMALCYVAAGYFAIAGLCRRRKYDIVHVHWPFPHALFGYAAKSAGGCRVVTSFYGVELRWVKSKLPFLKSFLTWAARSADAVTAISTYTAREVREISPRDVTIIPFGAALTESEQHETGDRGPGTNDILFVGRLVERKGVKYLIEALKFLPGNLNARLVIVGSGSERPNLEAQAREMGVEGRVVFTGLISAEEKERRYEQCRVLVLPAIVDRKGDTEGLGVVLLEAMTHYKPVIASNLGGITDIVKHEQTGLLVPEKDARALAAAIERVFSDSDLARKLAVQGHDHALKEFGWPGILDRIESVYRSVA